MSINNGPLEVSIEDEGRSLTSGPGSGVHWISPHSTEPGQSWGFVPREFEGV